MQNSKPIKNTIGYIFIAGIWAVFLALGAFFFGVFAIYADLKSPHTSFLSRWLGLEPIARTLYFEHFRPGWQDGKGYTQFDPELVYIPRPGQSKFQAAEFDVELTFGPDTTRVQPHPGGGAMVVVAGDSYAMGWGVRDDQTYSSLLATRYGWNTVNTGVASYGTAREFLRMRKLGLLKRAAAVVLEFCDNDPPENRAYLNDPDGFIKNSNAANLWKYMQGYRQSIVSYPLILQMTCQDIKDKFAEGRWLGFWDRLEVNRDPFGKRDDIGYSGPEMVRDFFKVLDRFPEMRDKPLIVTEISGDGAYSDFMAQLLRVAGQHPNVIPLVISYQRSDFFRFDDHLTPAGHATVAQAFNQALTKILHTTASGPNQPE